MVGVRSLTQGKHHYSHGAVPELDLCLAVTIWNPSAPLPQWDVVLGPRPLSQFLVSGTRNLELVMNEDLSVVTINNIDIDISSASCPEVTIIFPNNDPTVHIQRSLRPFWISEEVQFKNGARTQRTVPFLLSLLLRSHYSLRSNRQENHSFSSSTTLLLRLLRHSTIWWHVGDAPPPNTRIHQSLGHEFACAPTKLPRWFVCDCILDFFFF